MSLYTQKKQLSILTATEVNGSKPQGGLQTPLFDRPPDWDREIKRTGASEWRVCAINERYSICTRFVEGNVEMIDP